MSLKHWFNFMENEVCILQRITEIINKWDPANLMSHAPDDEYNYEVEKIKEIMAVQSDPTRLAHAIKEIFTGTFGSDIDFEMETYITIAKELLANR